ncbi:MAG: ABC transporter ATP-binding protein, partial [Asgard group archaeon]|nr:ABC transporter ATP-binding protein [Asgard group archaeon]
IFYLEFGIIEKIVIIIILNSQKHITSWLEEIQVHPVRRIYKLMTRKTKLAFLVVVIIAILESITTLATPKIVQVLIDKVYTEKEFDLLIPLIAIAVGLAIAKAIFLFLQRYLNEYVAQNVVYVIRHNLYSKIQNQSIDFFDRMESGQLISRGTIDIDAIRRLMNQGFRLILRAIILYIGIYVMIGISDVYSIIIISIVAPILFIIMYGYMTRSRPLFRNIQNKFGDLNSVLKENVRGARVVRAFATENFELEKFEKENEEYMNLNIKLAKLRSLMNILFPFILGIGSVALWYFGGVKVIDGNLMKGELVAFISYIALLQVSTRYMTFGVLDYQEGVAAMGRIYEIIDMENKIIDKPDAINLTEITGRIFFDNVSFAYREGGKSVLTNITLEILPGEVVAFLGTTGSGKSTIVSLVPRFYDPQEGAVYVDKTDIRDVKIESLRSKIALVQQEAFLFARTIRENIAFGKPDATDEEIIRVAKIAQAHDFIMETPNGYDTVVGERGVTLSGGQKQRLTIARALLLNYPILIMDDSSSALDFETENQFQKAINALVKNRTTLIVTQRLSTIKFATKIVVMDAGKIVEIGTHEELITKKGLYKFLYDTQLLSQQDTFDTLETTNNFREEEPNIEE